MVEPRQDTPPQPESSSQGRSPFESFRRRIDARFASAAPRVEEEVRRVIDYFNDEVNYLNDKVVPQVRRHSSSALHTAAAELDRLAQYLDRNPSARKGPQ